MVDDDSLLSGGDVLEACWPPFEGLETERKRVLSRCEPIALVNHGLALGEHVSCLVVGHFVVSTRRCHNILGSQVVASVLLRFNIGYNNVLNRPEHTSEGC